MDKISASQAARLLGITDPELELLKKQGLIHATEDLDGSSFYKSSEIARIKSKHGLTLSEEAAEVEAQIEKQNTSSISSFQKILKVTGGLVAGYLLLAAAFAVLFIINPLGTSNFFGYYYALNNSGQSQTSNLPSEGGNVLAASTGPADAALQTSVLADIIKPVTGASLIAVKAIDSQKYDQIVSNPVLATAAGGQTALPGTPGTNGVNGTNGADGAPGPEGPRGPAGLPGVATFGPVGPGGAGGPSGPAGPSGTNGTSVTDILTAPGQIIIRDGTNTTVPLTAGSSGQVLTISGGVPVWQNSGFTAAADAGAPATISQGGTLTFTALQNIATESDGFGNIFIGTSLNPLFNTVNGLNIINNGGNTLDIAAGKLFAVSNSLTFTGTDATSFNFPSGSDTLVGRNSTDTLTNKTIDAGSNTITGLTDANLSGSAGISNTNLANSFLTVNTMGPLSGGGGVALGGILTLSCPTCLASGSNLFTASATTGPDSSIMQGGTLTLAAGTNLTTTNSGTGTVTFATVNNPTFSGLLTAGNGFTLTTGALNLTGTSGALTLSGLGASSISTGVNTLTLTSSNFNVASTGIVTLKGAQTTDLTTPAATALTIDSGTTGNLNLGTSANAKSINLGTGAGVIETINIGGTGANIISLGNTQTAGSLSLGSAMTTGTITIGGTGAQTGIIAIGTGTGAQTLNFGTGGTGAKTVTLGSTASTGATNIQSGTGNINFTAGPTSSSGNIVIGNSGTATPDLLVLDNGTADPTGVAGSMYYNTSTKKFRCFQNGAWTNCIGGDRLLVPKTTDQSVTSSTTLTSDSALTFSVGSGETWIFNFFLFVTNASSAAPDFKASILGASGWTCGAQMSGAEAAGAAFPQAVTTDCDNVPGTMVNGNIASDTGNGFNVRIQGFVTTTSAGSVTLQFAQNTSSANSITIKGGSYVQAFKVGGADLAEAYSSNDLSITPGDVVSVDGTLQNGVQKSKRQYDSTVLGIVSTEPGMVLGDNIGSGVPVLVALSGRVPVKVSTENGAIKAGDYLTTSSTPGIAMKATGAGAIIGTAMVDYSDEGVGKIVAFVKNGSSLGSNSDEISGTDILMQLLSTDSNIGNQINITSSIKDVASTSGELVKTNIAEVNIVNYFTGIVSDLFKKTVEFFGQVIFHSDVAFLGRPTFNKDTAGFAAIQNGQDEVDVTFEKEYAHSPVVTTGLNLVGGVNINDVPAYSVYDVTTKGFKIKLGRSTNFDIQFAWTALAVDSAKTFQGQVSGASTSTAGPTASPNPTDSPTPSPDVTATPTPTDSPTVTPVQTESPAPTSIPSASP